MTHAYRGPVVCLTLPEAQRVSDLLDRTLTSDAGDAELLAKCNAALTSDPAWRTPLKNVR
jgi:hypothetical protein